MLAPQEVWESVLIMLILRVQDIFMCRIHGSHVALESRMAPSIFTWGLFLMEWEPMFTEMVSFFFLWLISIRLVLFGAKRKPEILDHDISTLVESCRSCWIVILLELRHVMVKSSAYSRGMFGLRTPWDMSLMAIRNNVTEIVDPWGTPFSCVNGSDRELDVFT